MATSKRIQFENLSRDVIHIPVVDGLPPECNGLFTLGDSIDTDGKVPKGMVRDPRFQPNPVVTVTAEQVEKFGKLFHDIVADQIAQRRIRRTELAA